MSTPNFVLPSGDKLSKIAIIGEAPGAREVEVGKPFIGPSGNLLWHLAAKVNIYRENCYVSNVLKTLIPNPMSTLSPNRLQKAVDEFRDEIREIKPNLIISLGATALYALTNYHEISLYRGSVLKAFNEVKVIPTFHPAYVLRSTDGLKELQMDLALCAIESGFPEIRYPERNLLTSPTLQEAIDFLLKIYREGIQGKPFAFDVETPGGIVNCISFANNPTQAMTIPLISNYWSKNEFLEIYKTIKLLLEEPRITKLGQNVSYDIIAMDVLNIHTVPPYHDTMHMHHSIDPTKPHSLAYLCSIFTREPFYKDWDQAPNAVTGLHEYCARDSATTIEIYNKIRIQEGPRFNAVYQKHYADLHPHLLDMYFTGISVDESKRLRVAQKLQKELNDQCEEIRTELNLKLFNPNSPMQISHIIYEILRCPKKWKTDLRTKKSHLTVEETALIDLALKTGYKVIPKIRAVREKAKLLSFVSPSSKSSQKKRTAWDHRLRSEYKPMTATGRLSSSESLATKTGTNLQNIPQIVRQIFVPEKGNIFLKGDLSQAEARVIAWDSRDFKLMENFEKARLLGKDNYDIHRDTAALLFNKLPNLINSKERDVSKRVVFGTFYDMQEQTQRETILKEIDILLSLEECKRNKERYQALYPLSTTIRQSRIRKEVLETKMQINCFGNYIIYHEVINDPELTYYFGIRDYSKTFRAAYSFIPQSVVAKHTNQCLIKLNIWLRQNNIGRIAAQVHDELLAEVTNDLATLEVVFKEYKRLFETPIVIRKEPMIIPVEIKIGYDWYNMKGVETIDQLENVWRYLNETKEAS